MTFAPKHGEQQGSDRWDRAAMAWVPADEWQRRQWDREDRAFARRANQGQICTPMLAKPWAGFVTGDPDNPTFIDDRGQRREYMRQNGLEDWDDGVGKRNRWVEDYDEKRDIVGTIKQVLEQDPANRPPVERIGEGALGDAPDIVADKIEVVK